MLCASFVNTASSRRKSLETYHDFVVWGQQNAGLSSGEAQRLERAAGERPEAAAEVAEKARQLHATLARILEALIAPPPGLRPSRSWG